MKNTLGTAVMLGLAISLASCVPWTVRPIGHGAKPAEGSHVTITPAAYVESVWASKLVPAVLNSAVDARELLTAIAASPAAALERFGRRAPSGGSYYIVKGEGIVIAVDTRSRAGLALVDIAPFDQRPDLSIQIGPVLRGNSLRDATGIVRFSDFVNQLQFADAGNEINSRVLKTVLGPLDMSRIKGRTVSFAGALEAREKVQPPLAELAPVTLTIRERQ